MKIRITPACRKKLQAARKKLSGQREEFRQHDARTAELRSQAETIPGEIAEMQSDMDPSNEAGLLALAAKQSKLNAIRSKLADAEAVDNFRHREMRAALAPAATAISECLAPVLVEAEREIAAYLAVVFEEGRAAVEARASNQVRILVGVAQCNFAQFSDLILAAREATRVLDVLLSGDLPFVNLPGERRQRSKPTQH